jgi:hypothetical protein
MAIQIADHVILLLCDVLGLGIRCTALGLICIPRYAVFGLTALTFAKKNRLLFACRGMSHKKR